MTNLFLVLKWAVIGGIGDVIVTDEPSVAPSINKIVRSLVTHFCVLLFFNVIVLLFAIIAILHFRFE